MLINNLIMKKQELIEKVKTLEEYIEHNEHKYIPDNSTLEIDLCNSIEINNKFSRLQAEINQLKSKIDNLQFNYIDGNRYVATIRSIEPTGKVVTFNNINYQNFDIVLTNSNIVYTGFINIDLKLCSMDKIQFIFQADTNSLRKVKIYNS